MVISTVTIPVGKVGLLVRRSPVMVMALVTVPVGKVGERDRTASSMTEDAPLIVHVFPVESTAVSVSESPTLKSAASKSATSVVRVRSLYARALWTSPARSWAVPPLIDPTSRTPVELLTVVTVANVTVPPAHPMARPVGVTRVGSGYCFVGGSVVAGPHLQATRR